MRVGGLRGCRRQDVRGVSAGSSRSEGRKQGARDDVGERRENTCEDISPEGPLVLSQLTEGRKPGCVQGSGPSPAHQPSVLHAANTGAQL